MFLEALNSIVSEKFHYLKIRFKLFVAIVHLASVRVCMFAALGICMHENPTAIYQAKRKKLLSARASERTEEDAKHFTNC